MRRKSGAWGYNWATLLLEEMNTKTWSPGKGLMNLLCKRITVAKSKEVKTRHNRAKSSKEGCDSKRAVLPVMMMNDHTEAKKQCHMN
jgi:hypothetical protein